MKYRRTRLILILLFFAGMLSSCSKKDDGTSTPSWPGNQKLLDRNLSINYAKDNGGDITSNFNGATFRFNGASALSGAATVTTSSFTVNGSWNMNNTHDRISFTFPTAVYPELVYLNQTWIMTNVTTSPLVLNATFGVDDEVRFTVL